MPILFATTGYDDMQYERMRKAAAVIPIFCSPNLSIGIYMLNRLVCETARILEQITDASGIAPYDIEIIEKHHNRKVDAPSGTAVNIANNIANTLSHTSNFIFDRHNERRPRDRDEIGIHTIRGGTIIGEHTVMFAGTDEVIEVTHKAESSAAFAKGAISAAHFITGKQPGMYNMKDMLEGS